MRIFIVLGLLLSGFAVGCHRADPPGQWIFESYNANTGYVFRKDGVHYRAECFTTTFRGEDPIESRRQWQEATGKTGSENPNEDVCSEVLPYLHKVITMKDDPETHPMLDYTDPNGTVVEFEIVEAK